MIADWIAICSSLIGIFLHRSGILKPAEVAAAFPVVEATSTFTASSGPHSVPLPSGVTDGDLLLMLCIDSADGLSTPSGWSVLLDENLNADDFAIFYKVASSEGSTVTVDSNRLVASLYRISGYQGSPEENHSTNILDPPSLSPSWGSASTLWIAALIYNSSSSDISFPSSYPSNYGNELEESEDPSLGTSMATVSARRELVASSENPGAFTASDADMQTVAATIAIRPA